MLAEIEKAIVAQIESGGLSVRDVEIQGDAKNIRYPAVFAAVEAGEFKKAGQKKYKCTATVVLLAAFKNLKSEKARRHGLYPILEGIVALLMLRDFDLDIDPLRPVGFRNITDDKLAKKGLLLYQFEFETGFTVEPSTDEELVAWLSLALEYYLQDPANDDTAVASDIVILEEA